MNLLDLYESRDMCNVCGQTPCNCTHLTEGVAKPGRKLIELFNLIYSNGGDDAVDYLLYNSPIFADYYDQYEGDLESIAAEVDAKELQVMVDELEEVAENEGLAEGWREKLAGAALAGAMTFGGAGKAMANDAPVNPDQDRPAVTQVQKQKVDMEKVYQLDQKMQDTNPKYAQERAQLPPMVRGIGPAASARNEKVWNMVADLLVKYGQRVNEGLAEGLGQNLSVQQLATISDEALDKAYGYGRSTPGNTFGWQANLMSAAYAKKMIDAGVTDIEAISDAIHKGWNVTAQKFVQNPDQFDDTEKLRQAGKLDAKLQQRAKLMKINYAQLDNEEQEKDRVVARALLQAIKGQQNVAEGSEDLRAKLDLYNEKAFEAGHRHDDQAWRKYTKLAKQIADQLGLKYKVTGYGLEILEQGVAEGSNDTVYPNAEVIKSKNGKPVGEIYQDDNGWGCFHYRADRGYDTIDSREDAIQALKDLHQETGRNRPDYTIKGVAEVSDATLTSYLTKVDADSQKHEKDPTKRSPEKRNKSVQGFARAFNKLDARKEPVNEISPEGPDSDEDYREWERLKDVHKKPYNPDWDDDDEEFMQKWYRERGLEEQSGLGFGEADEKEADYGKSYQDMVKRMGAKAREQEQSRPVDIGDLARRLRAIEKKSGN